MADFRALVARMADELDHYRQVLSGDRRDTHALAREARAALAQPEPQPPAAGEVAELVARLRDWHSMPTLEERERIAELLQRLAPPQPIPVSERLPEAGDCAPWPGESDPSFAWCWLGSDVDGGWEWEQRSAGCLQEFPDDYTHWLPAHALPLPSGEVE